MVSENDRKLYQSCKICPRGCGADRVTGSRGICSMGSVPVVNISMHHYGEEPPISGEPNGGGSGAIFFEGCPMRCPFCQNFSISRGNTGMGREFTSDQLSDLYLKLQDEGAHNINLVTALHFAPDIARSLENARNHGLTIPVVVNSGGYESVDTLKMLDGLVDIYLPDMKVWSSKLANDLFHAPDYAQITCIALEEMYRQTGKFIMGDDGFMRRGMIVRHLMLPGQLFDTKKVLDYLVSTFGNNIYISLMNQYTPMPQLEHLNCPAFLNRRLSPGHYDAASDYLLDLGQENAFIQVDDASGDEMIPDFKS